MKAVKDFTWDHKLDKNVNAFQFCSKGENVMEVVTVDNMSKQQLRMFNRKSKDVKKSDAAFRKSYEKYYNLVYKQLYYLVGNNELAEDLTQEVFIKYYRKKDRINYLGAWLSKVATNTAFNYLRGEKRRIHREESVFEEAHAIFSAEDEVFRNEEIKSVRKVLAHLDKKQSICLILKFSGYTYDEIHQATGIPKNNISQLIARGKRKFVEQYKKEGE